MPPSSAPLIVDLDGTLINSDLLIETAFEYCGRFPLRFYHLPLWLLQGRPTLKQKLSENSRMDMKFLPYRQDVLEYIRAARADGRKVYLASASDKRLVQAVAEHIGLFDGWFASDGTINLSSHAKATHLSDMFGRGEFDYIGNAKADLPVWRASRNALLVNVPASVHKVVKGENITHEVLVPRKFNLRVWIKLIRVHQWAKNALVFVALLTAHAFTPVAFLQALAAFFAFSFCASGVYVVNDLIDIEADRQHPSKKERPFAKGTVPLTAGFVLAPLLTIAAFAIAFLIGPMFAAVLLGYLITTTAYTFYLKRKMLIDAVTLAALYTVRVVGGAVAISVVTSQWLLAFSMFLFLSLALIKRYSEMALRFDAGLPDPTNRNYRAADLPVLSSLAASSGYCAVIVFSLYLASDAVGSLYRHPHMLWLSCPLFLYWISRMLMISHRRLMHDDPVVFALRDRVSVMVALLILALGGAAI